MYFVYGSKSSAQDISLLYFQIRQFVNLTSCIIDVRAIKITLFQLDDYR